MKRVRIGQGRMGIVSRNGDFRKALAPSVYWTFPFEEVAIYDRSKPFYSQFNLRLLLQDPLLASHLDILEVADTQIALQYENGIFRCVLEAGTYAFWKGITDFSFIMVDLTKSAVTEAIDKNVLVKPEVAKYLRVFVVESYEAALMFVDGKFREELTPGIYYFWKTPEAISVMKADTRTLQLEIPGQEILTKDKAALRISFTLLYKIVAVQKALVENKAYEKQLYTATQLALRAYVGTMTLDELLDKKDEVAAFVMKALTTKAEKLGLAVMDAGIKDLILPGDVKEIMSKVLIAQKNAQANIITRREETASTRSLLNTAKLMEENSMLFKLKEMEYVEKIAEKINSISLSGGNQIVDQMREIFS